MDREMVSLLLLTCSLLPLLAPVKAQVDPGCTSTSDEAFFEASCWAQLDLTNWLNNWKSPKTCGSGDFGVDCCLANEAWSTCFLRLGKGDGGLNCTQINTNTNDCVYTPQLAPDLDPKTRAQYRYITKTIFNVNAFFVSWYTALQYATTQTSLSIDPIVNGIDPHKKSSALFDDILTALIAGLPFIGQIPALASNTIGKVFTTAVSGAPGVVKALYSQDGSAESQNVEIASLDTELANAVSQIGDRLNAALWILMSDQQAFASFASSGSFSENSGMSLPQEVEGLSAALTVFVLSKALVGNGYYLIFDPLKQLGDGTSDDICTKDQSLGGDYCYHNDTLFGGSIGYLGKFDGDNNLDYSPVQFMKTIADNNWASQQALYQGALQCAADGKFGADLVNIAADGSLDLTCLSQLTACFDASYVVTCDLNGKCPIQNCPGRPLKLYRMRR